MNIFEVAPADYHRKLRCNRADLFSPDSWLSKSVLWELQKCSLYKWRYHPTQKKITPQMQWGSLVDCLTTTPELAQTELAFCEFDSFRTNAAKEWRDAAIAAGKIIVTPETLTEGRKAAEMLLKTCRESAEIFAASKSQVILCAKIRGMNVKGLVDLAPEGADFLADLKTTANFSRKGFDSTIADFGYHVQAGLYLVMWNAMFPNDQRKRFKLVWQDSEPPYEVAIGWIDQSDIDDGYKLAMRHIRRLAEAAKENYWPMAFAGEELQHTRPTWAAIREEEEAA